MAILRGWNDGASDLDDLREEPVEYSYLCRTGRHQRCGNPQCDCECHYAMKEWKDD